MCFVAAEKLRLRIEPHTCMYAYMCTHIHSRVIERLETLGHEPLTCMYTCIYIYIYTSQACSHALISILVLVYVACINIHMQTYTLHRYRKEHHTLAKKKKRVRQLWTLAKQVFVEELNKKIKIHAMRMSIFFPSAHVCMHASYVYMPMCMASLHV